MSLPYFQTSSKDISLLQSSWASQLNKLLGNPLVQGRLINNVMLTTGTNVINHGLGRKLQGWIIVGINAASTIFDLQSSNTSPQLTLDLSSSAPCQVNLYVF